MATPAKKNNSTYKPKFFAKTKLKIPIIKGLKAAAKAEWRAVSAAAAHHSSTTRATSIVVSL